MGIHAKSWRYWMVMVVMLVGPVRAYNVLQVHIPNKEGYKPGYIQEATLVVEPHGSYAEQSLYLTYSDRGGYSSSSLVEIVHQFELPYQSVINDMWLWIGDSVMQAIMMDTWTAHHVYDSIVGTRRDPAFLCKKGLQYVLNVYPMNGGSTRKVKINFITPVSWSGNKASLSLPIPMLKAAADNSFPFVILFRTQQPVWTDLEVQNMPQIVLTDYLDTLGYHYKRHQMAGIGNYSTMTMRFSTTFQDGIFFRGFRQPDNQTAFQIGISPNSLFQIPRDTLPKKIMVAMDFSGPTQRNLSALLPEIETVLDSLCKPNDQVQLMVTGSDQYQKFSDGWHSSDQMNALLNEFQTSQLGQEIESTKKTHVFFCDDWIPRCWMFPALEDYATWEQFESLQQASQYLERADVVAAYEHGFSDHPIQTETEFNLVVERFQKFFKRGGRLILYYDYNRTRGYRLQEYYIKNLTHSGSASSNDELIPNKNGRIGRFYSENFNQRSFFCVNYNDPEVVTELSSKSGLNVVISKPIENGLVIITGIWSFMDDDALKAKIYIPMFGLNQYGETSGYQLSEILNRIRTEYQTSQFDKAILFSNSDSLPGAEMSRTMADAYLAGYSGNFPVIHTVNLCSYGRYQTIDGDPYYHSGYLQACISEKTHGIHYETAFKSWDIMANGLNPSGLPQIKSFRVAINPDIPGSLIDSLEVNPNHNDPDKPIFIIGSSKYSEYLTFDIQTEFLNYDSVFQVEKSYKVDEIPAHGGEIIPSMLGYEKLKDLLANHPKDTAEIVALAMKYNLLCDYTALLALEPNDSLHFMTNPFDESSLPTGIDEDSGDESISDSLRINLYPNPFQQELAIMLQTDRDRRVDVEIYNIFGQRVARLWKDEPISGRRIVRWSGTNEQGESVSSGVYLVRISSRRPGSDPVTVQYRKVLRIK